VDEQVDEPAVTRARRRDLPEALELATRPRRKVTGFGDRLEHETGRTLHLLDGRETRCAAGPCDEARSAVVTRHQRPLGGGERHVEIPVRVEAVHAQRADHACGDLGHANELLDVAAEVGRVDLGQAPGEVRHVDPARAQELQTLVASRRPGVLDRGHLGWNRTRRLGRRREAGGEIRDRPQPA